MNTFEISDGKVFVNDVEIKDVNEINVKAGQYGSFSADTETGTAIGEYNLITIEFKAQRLLI